MKLQKKMGAPRKDPSAARVNKTIRLHPNTWAIIARLSNNKAMSTGEVIDWLAARPMTYEEYFSP